MFCHKIIQCPIAETNEQNTNCKNDKGTKQVASFGPIKDPKPADKEIHARLQAQNNSISQTKI